MRGIVGRFVLLVVLLALANVWTHLHFGVELSTLLLIDLVLGIALSLAKALEDADSEALKQAARTVLYGALNKWVLALAWIAFLGVTLSVSAIVVKGERADQACLDGDTKDCQATLTSEKQSRFLKWTLPWGRFCPGRFYFVMLDDSDRLPLLHIPWRPSIIDLAKLTYAPSVLVRVPYPHSSLVGGAIQIRDPLKKIVLASVPTSAISASLLLGRTVALPITTPAWDAEIALIPERVQQKVRDRWRAPLVHSLKIAPKDELEAVFRTAAQLETTEWDDIFASKPFTVERGSALSQDVGMVKK